MYFWSDIHCFFFKQKTAYEMRISDWSSDVCSSDLRIGARHQGEHAGMRRIGDEALGAVDDVMIALAFGAGPDAGGIRAGLGFGQGEAGNHLAAGPFGEPGRLLLRRTVHQDALAADADIGADHAAAGRRGPATLEDQQNGSAACRARLYRYVDISGGGGAL